MRTRCETVGLADLGILSIELFTFPNLGAWEDISYYLSRARLRL
jgi:hypothetical protein